MSSARKLMTDQEIDTLLEKSRSNNVKNNITGLLLYIDGDFLQILEGEKASVESLLKKIEQDQRHNTVIPVFKDFVEERQFADWSMGFSKTSYQKLQKENSFKDISKAALVNINDKTAIIFIDSFVNSHKIEIVYT